jgi:hypothetical protein
MNAGVEAGIVAYLTARLAAAEITATALAGTGMASVPNAVPTVIVVVAMPHTVDVLYEGGVKVIVSTPSKRDNFSVTTHQALARKVKQKLAWDSTDETNELAADYQTGAQKLAALNTAVHTASGYRTAGYWLKDMSDAQDDDMWQTVLEITLGLSGPHATAS